MNNEILNPLFTEMDHSQMVNIFGHVNMNDAL